MGSLTKSVGRKRQSGMDTHFGRNKRICLESFFTEEVSPEIMINKFHNQTQKLEDGDINLDRLKSITKTVKQMREHGLLKDLKVSDVMKIIKKLINFIKTGFIRDFQSSYEWDLLKWKSNVEVTFEACLICLLLLSSEEILEGEDIDIHVNDIIFFLRKVFDDVNTQLMKVRNVKKINNASVKELLLDNLSVVNKLIRIRNFNSLNVTGLITSFIHTVLYHTDPDIQKSALLSIVGFYRKGEEFRALILNLILKAIGRVQEHYKFKRNYGIHDSLSVSMFTALIMALVENVPVVGVYTYETCDMSSMQNSQNLLKESLENIMKVTCFIITTFIQRIGNTSIGHKSYSFFFGHLVGELIQVSNEPDWPSAKLILNLLLKPLTEILMLKPPGDTPLRIFTIKVLSDIIKKKIIDKNKYEEILESLNQKFTNLDEECDFTEFTQRLLVHRIRKSVKKELNANCELLHAIQWFDYLKHKPNFEEKVSNLMKLFKECHRSGDYIPDINEDETRAILHYLDTVRRNYVDHNVILKYVLCCCYDKNKKVKCTATQCVFEMINLDAGLLSQSMVSNIVHENLLLLSASQKEKLCAAIAEHVMNHPEKCEDYTQYLLRLLDIHLDGVRKIIIDLVLKIIKNQSKLNCKTQLCYKVLTLIHSDYPAVQKQVIDFCSQLWLCDAEENVNTLLAVVDMPNAGRYLRMFFEEKLKPPVVSVMSDTPSQPPTQAVESCRNLFGLILDKIRRNERTLHCLQTLSIFVTAYPKAFVPDLFDIAGPLTCREYTKDYAVEILTAEILNCILPEVVNPDVLNYIILRSVLVDRLLSNEGLNYAMGFIVSLLKLVNNLSKFDTVFLYESCLQPSMNTLREYMIKLATPDNRIINRALCIAVYFHVYFPTEYQNFHSILKFYIEHRIFCLTTIHCLCYHSIDFKSIMNNETVKKTIERHLKNKRNSVLLRAVLYNILCSLKNISRGQCARKDESIEPVKALIQYHISDILDCIIDERTGIRQVAHGVIRHLLTSGLISESRLIPSVLLMSTDPVESLADVGMDTLFQMQRKKLFDFTRSAEKCIIASLVFNLKCLKQDFIRGYVNRKGRMEAKCNHFYVLYQEDVIMRRQIIDSVVMGISPESEMTAREKFYLAENLAFFTYKYQEEVYYVLWQIENLLTTTYIPDIPVNPKDKHSYIDKYYGVYCLVQVKCSLMYYYGFKGVKLKKYYQEDGKRDLVQTKKYFVFEMPQNFLPNSKDVNILCETIFNAVKNQPKHIPHSSES